MLENPYITKTLVCVCYAVYILTLAVCLKLLIKLLRTLSKTFEGKVTEPCGIPRMHGWLLKCDLSFV